MTDGRNGIQWRRSQLWRFLASVLFEPLMMLLVYVLAVLIGPFIYLGVFLYEKWEDAGRA